MNNETKGSATLYRVEWLHNNNWRMEVNDGLVFVKKEEAYVAAENEKVKSPGLITRVVEIKSGGTL